MNNDRNFFINFISNIGSKQIILLIILTLLSIIVLFPLGIMILLCSKSYPQIVASFWKLPNPFMWRQLSFRFKSDSALYHKQYDSQWWCSHIDTGGWRSVSSCIKQNAHKRQFSVISWQYIINNDTCYSCITDPLSCDE